jgi:hypothetical protein
MSGDIRAAQKGLRPVPPRRCGACPGGTPPAGKLPRRDGDTPILPYDEEFNTERAHARQADMLRRMAGLGMEPHSDWCLIYTPAVIAGGQVALRVETTDARLDIDAGGTGWLRDWDGYGFELFGQVIERREGTGRPGRFILQRRRGSGAFQATAAGSPTITADVWQIRAAAERREFYAEFRWHPLAGWHGPAIHGPWSERYDKEAETAVREARKAVRLLLNLPAIMQPGPKRGHGPGHPTEQHRLDTLEENVRPKQARVTADDATIARWRGCGN